MDNASTAQIFQSVVLTEIFQIKFVVITFMSVFFITLNCIMVYTLLSKVVFKETPRYILFTHMLVNDSVQLVVTYILYVFTAFMYSIISFACAFVIFVSTTTFTNAPLNLAAMSLERYVAICFPLRHAQIVTQKITYAAIGAMWFISSINFLLDFFYIAAANPTFLFSIKSCSREYYFLKPWQVDVFQGLKIFFFLSVTIIVIFSYVSIMITARSFSSNKEPATKAHRTVFLHMIQLGLCSTSFLYVSIEQAVAKAGSSSYLREIRYINYLFVLILPRCLSPLIYGLRDEAIRQIFMHYICFARRKHANVINIH